MAYAGQKLFSTRYSGLDQIKRECPDALSHRDGEHSVLSPSIR